MSIEESEQVELDQLLILEEFRYWDAYRNNVPKAELEDIAQKIKKLKTTMISMGKLKELSMAKKGTN